MYKKITISGKACTGKTTLYENLHKTLGWETFSAGQFFRDYAKKKGVTIESAKEQDEKITKEVDNGVLELLKEKEKVIVEGWMAGIMADNLPQVLRILLESDDTVRFKRFSKREKVSFEEAKKRIIEREKNLFNKYEIIYHRKDFIDHKNYNLIIDTSRLSPEEILEIVLKQVKNP